MAERTSVYGPKTEFNYPLPYSVAQDEDLFALDNARYRSDIPFSLEFSPRQALIEWANSSPGQWQSGQTARYSLFHKDFPDELVPSEYSGREQEFKLNLLKIMAFGAGDLSGDPAHLDFDPIGHMARVGCVTDEVVWQTMLPPHRMTHDLMMLDATRHASVLHDAGESEHSGVVINHDKPLGDVPAPKGKTAEQRAKELAILSDVLEDTFLNRKDPVYNAEFLNIMIRLISHDIEGADRDFLKHHGMLEIAHNLNSVRTGIYIGHLACKVAEPYANVLSVLSWQGVGTLKPKFEEVFEHSPELIAPFSDQVEQALRELEINAHSRDENENWLKWRLSDKVSDPKYYGEYEPWTF